MDIINNKRAFRYEVHFAGGDPAVLEYRWLKGNMVIMHTIVPKEQRLKGIASQLVKYVLDQARAHNYKVIAYCPFAEKYMSEHPEYDDIAAPR